MWKRLSEQEFVIFKILLKSNTSLSAEAIAQQAGYPVKQTTQLLNSMIKKNAAESMCSISAKDFKKVYSKRAIRVGVLK